MYREISKLVIYRNLPEDSILFQMAKICEDFENKQAPKEFLVSRIYEQIHRLLDVATQYGFDRNLWQNYLAYVLATLENPFSITCEKSGAQEGTVNRFAKNDFRIFKALFHYDFEPIQSALEIDCFDVITNYQSIAKPESRYYKSVSDKVKLLSRQIEQAADENAVFLAVTEFYRNYGVGKFGLNKAFRIKSSEDGIAIYPITNTEEISFSDLIGYELQKKKLIENTDAFVEGKKANNVLMFGDSGTGKSTCIKALINRYYDRGLRIVEIYKHQFQDLSTVISQIKNRNYKFIIYMDDLSFEDFEIEYKYLKAIIEGGLETKPDNVLIYATSNRRHLIKETWNDRADMTVDNGMHKSDTMQEKLSLVNRFGVTISFSKPSQKEYFEIVEALARKEGITEQEMSGEELQRQANQWELSHGGISGRTARQFVHYLLGKR